MKVYLFLKHRRDTGFNIGEIIKAKSGRKYKVEERLNSGGNAVVHRCVDSITGDDYAIKIQLSLDSKCRVRFEREVELIKQLQHDQLVRCIDDGDVLGNAVRPRQNQRDLQTLPFLIMPLADSNLSQLIKQQRNPPLYDDYIGQFKGLANALAVLHGKAVHRDIKPENILIRGETWVLSDLGLCKFDDCEDDITETDPLGPRYWMSPEGLNRAIGNSDQVGKRSDVFQLCSVFWFVVTGRNPAGVVSKNDWNGPDNIFSVIYDSLSHDERQRPSSGGELVERLNLATLPTG